MRHTFPMMTRDDICVCLGEIGLNVTQDDLTKPKPDMVQHIYEALVELCMGTTREEMHQPRFAGLEALQHPELHEDSIPVVAFIRELSKLLEVSGVPDSHLRDVLKPDPKRLQRNLSAIINFAKFREERHEVFSKFEEETEAVLAEKLTREEEHAELLRKRDDIVAKREAEMPKITALKEECEALENQINDLNTQQAVLRHESNEIKDVTKKIKTTIAETETETQEAIDKANKLTSQIVLSPDRLKRELADMKETLDEEKASIEEIEAQKRELAARLDLVQRAEKDLSKTIALMSEAEEESSKFKKAGKDFKALQQRLDVLTAERTEKTTEAAHLDRAIKRVSGKLEAFRPDAEVQTEAVERALQTAQADLRALSHDVENLRTTRTEGSARRAKIVKTRAEERAKHQAQVDQMVDTFKSLRTSVTVYQRRLLESIANANPSSAAAARPATTMAVL